MIGSINSNLDIESFVNKEELERLLCTTVTGNIINLRYWKRQGDLYMLMKEELEKNKKGLSVKVYNSDFTENKPKDWIVDIHFGEAEYKQIIQTGRLILKYDSGYLGKIGIYEVSRLQPKEKEALERLESLRNKKNLE